MSEMVERIAAALADSDEYDDWISLTDTTKKHFRTMAVDALKAAREPTATMKLAGAISGGPAAREASGIVWTRMIDAALALTQADREHR